MPVKKITSVADRAVFFLLSLLIFVQPFSKAAIEIYFSTALLFWSVKKIAEQDLRRLKTELDKPLAALLIIAFISVVLSVDFHLSIKAFFGKLLEGLFLFVMAVDTVNTKKRLKIIGVVILFTTLLMLADGFIQYFTGFDFLRRYDLENGYKVRASFFSGNGFGAWLGIMTVFALSLILCGRIKSLRLRVVILICTVLNAILLFLTYSRGAWFAFVVGVLFLSVFLTNRWKLFLLSISMLIAFLAFYKLNINPFSALERVALWKEALMIIRDFPLFGTGLNTYSIVAPKYVLAD